MSKGTDTKLAILDKALDMASELGLEGVTIGILAKATGMSKSGLFAHFQSKENLQVEILRHAGKLFADSVVVPSLQAETGIPRIKTLVRNWTGWTNRLSGGCIFVTASIEFSEREGIVRNFLLQQQLAWMRTLRKLAKAAVNSGEFRSDADCDQFVFELYSLLLGTHMYRHLLQSEQVEQQQAVALNQLLDRYRTEKKNN